MWIDNPRYDKWFVDGGAWMVLKSPYIIHRWELEFAPSPVITQGWMGGFHKLHMPLISKPSI